MAKKLKGGEIKTIALFTWRSQKYCKEVGFFLDYYKQLLQRDKKPGLWVLKTIVCLKNSNSMKSQTRRKPNPRCFACVTYLTSSIITLGLIIYNTTQVVFLFNLELLSRSSDSHSTCWELCSSMPGMWESRDEREIWELPSGDVLSCVETTFRQQFGPKILQHWAGPSIILVADSLP